MRKIAFTFILSILSLAAGATQVGQWNFYLSYLNITDIEPAGKMIYVLSSEDLFSYNTADNSIICYNKGTGLNDSRIKLISWCESAKKLVIVYNNNNIDLLDNDGNITSMSEYYNKSMTEDKTINRISISGQYAYLSTAFGIVKLNVKDENISNSYNIGYNIADVALVNGYIYATSTASNRIFRGNTETNLLDKTNWETVCKYSATRLFNLKNQLCGYRSTWVNKTLIGSQGQDSTVNVHRNDIGIYTLNASSKQLDFKQFIMDEQTTAYDFIDMYQGHIVASCQPSTVDVQDTDSYSYYKTPGVTVIAYDTQNNCYWANQENQKMQQLTFDAEGNSTATLTDLAADGPTYNYFFFMKYANDKLYSTGGGFFHGNWLSDTEKRKACVQTKDEENNWELFEENIKSYTNIIYNDLSSLDIDPLDPSHVFVSSAHSGVYEFRDGKFEKHWNYKNSPLKWYKGSNKDYVMVNSVRFDNEGNLWVTNDQSFNTLLVYTKDGEWVSHTNEEFNQLYEGDLKQNLFGLKSLTIDSRGLVWFVGDYSRNPVVFCHNPQTNTIKVYNNFVNQDGTKFTVGGGVRCCTEDKEGNIWIGTNAGLLVYMADDIESGNEVFTQIKVPRNDGTNFADYLLAGVDINCICVDEANRKWIGTLENGAYLISDDNIQELEHFTTTSSEIISNNIESIAINNKTGEVFFGTANGLCSYMSNATTPSEQMSSDNVYAYPNPVSPDYSGPITVVGLSMNSDVKIVTSNGTLVAEGRSQGGSFTWDGCDLEGRRVASGVYMVLAATAEGKKGVVSKIAVIK